MIVFVHVATLFPGTHCNNLFFLTKRAELLSMTHTITGLQPLSGCAKKMWIPIVSLSVVMLLRTAWVWSRAAESVIMVFINIYGALAGQAVIPAIT